MSLTKFTPADTSSPASPNRRQNQRYEPRELTYVDLGPDNGGLLLNISEGGLGFEGIVALRDGQVVPVEFKLPGTSITIRATCRFARKEDAGRGGGLRFIGLTDEARQQIREWIATKAGRQEDSPLSPGNGAVSEAAEAADVKGKIELTDFPTPTREPQPAAPSLEPNVDSIAPVPRPASPAPATLRADGRSASGARTAADHFQRSPSQAAPKTSIVAEPKLPLQAKQPDPGGLRNQKNRAAVSPRQSPITPVLTYKAKPAANQKKNGARGPLNFGSQVLQFVAGIAAGCLAMVVIAGALLWAGYLQLPSAAASRTSTQQSATGQSNPDFQVEIVSINDQRWMLSIGEESNLQPTEQPATSQLGPPQSPTAVPPRAAAPTAEAPTRSASVPGPQLALQRPRAVGETPGSASLQAPALFQGTAAPMPSALSSLGSSVPLAPAPALAPPEPAAVPAAAALPSAPKPEARSEGAKTAKPGSFRPAELTRRFDPAYPPLAKQQHIQGTIQISATIGKDGLPRDLKVVGGNPQFADAAFAAIAQWRYKPAMLDGQPAESQLTITIKFQL